MRHDIVQLAGNAGPFAASGVLLEGIGHRLVGGLAGSGLASQAASPAEADRARRHRGQSDRQHGARARIGHREDA